MRLLTQKQAQQLDELSVDKYSIPEKSLMAMAGDDDDRHGALDEIFGNFQFFLMPVLFSMLLQNVTDAIDLFED